MNLFYKIILIHKKGRAMTEILLLGSFQQIGISVT
ncbi:MAG: hypothetical protein K0S47_4314 [Herbinix sp.]|jgi:hypothetical protein|nr:hypothetical protein [Herbinix sp.]